MGIKDKIMKQMSQVGSEELKKINTAWEKVNENLDVMNSNYSEIIEAFNDQTRALASNYELSLAIAKKLEVDIPKPKIDMTIDE